MKNNIINFEERKRNLSNTIKNMLDEIEKVKNRKINVRLNQEELFTLLYILIEYLILSTCILDSEIYDDVDLEEIQVPFDSDMKIQCSLISKLYSIYVKCPWIGEVDVPLLYEELSQALMSFDCLCNYNLESVDPTDKDESIQLYIHALLRRLTLKTELELEVLQNKYDNYRNKRKLKEFKSTFEEQSTKAFLESLKCVSQIELDYLSEYRKINFIYNRPLSIDGTSNNHSFFLRNTLNPKKSTEWLNASLIKEIKGTTTNTLFELELNIEQFEFNREYILNEIKNKFNLSLSEFELFLDCDMASRLGELDAYKDTLKSHIAFTLGEFTDISHRVNTENIIKFLKSISE